LHDAKLSKSKEINWKLKWCGKKNVLNTAQTLQVWHTNTLSIALKNNSENQTLELSHSEQTCSVP